jgi:hypothetical protein
MAVEIQATTNPLTDELVILLRPHGETVRIKISKVRVHLDQIEAVQLGTEEAMMDFQLRYEQASGGCHGIGCMLNASHEVPKGSPAQENHAALIKGELVLWSTEEEERAKEYANAD